MPEPLILESLQLRSRQNLIISKTPLRLSLGGGGTDLPHYYQRYGGHIVTGAIQKYIYVFAKRWFEKGIRISYSKTELVSSIDEIQHPIVREALKLLGPSNQVELVSMADVPAKSGMGSSASFTVGLLNALYSINKVAVNPDILAEIAFKIQNDILKEVGGKQDQYAAAFGGIISMQIDRQGKVTVRNITINEEVIEELENNLVCFYTGLQRDSSDIQKTLVKPQCITSSATSEVEDQLHKIKAISIQVEKALEEGNLTEFGSLLHKHWQAKRCLSSYVSNSIIDMWYQKGIKAGALGGKIMGAGGGGFLVFYCDPLKKNRLRKEMVNQGLEEIKLRFDFDGSKIVANI